MMRPESWTVTYFVTLTPPSSVSTSTSHEMGAEGARAPCPRARASASPTPTSTWSPVGMPFSAICFCRSRAASTTAEPVMMVVRLPDSPTEYGQRSVSPQTTSTFDSGTPQRFRRDQPHRGLGAGADVGDANKQRVRPAPFNRMTALLGPSPERNDHVGHAGAALDRAGIRRPASRCHRAFQSNRSAPRRMHSSSE